MVVLVVGSIGTAGLSGTVAAQESGEVIGQPNISFATTTGDVSAGKTDTLSLSITNRGKIDKGGPSQYENRVTTARGMTMSLDDENSPIDINVGELAVGNVPTGSSQVDVPITVAESAEPGTYKIPVEYEYQYTRAVDYDAYGAEYSDFTRTQTGSITVAVTEDARFEVVAIQGAAQVGDNSDVSVTIRNTGSQLARGASVTVNSRSNALTFDSGGMSASSYVGDWQSGETREVNYSVALAPDATQRGYTLDLTVNYDDTDGISQTSEPITAGVETIAKQAFRFSEVTSSLRVGEDGEVVGTVTNQGPQTAHSVVVRYAGTTQTVIPIEDSVAVGSLAAGESTSFRLPIEVSSEAEAGAKSLDFAVDYRNLDRDQRTYDKLDIRAAVAPERDQFSVELAEQSIETGGSRTISVEVTNNLNETVTDVEARLFADNPLDTGDADTGYREALDPDETVTMTFELTAAGSATPEKTYPISFDFRYDDERGNSQLTNTMRVPIDVVESSGGGLPIPLIAGVIVVVGGAAAVLWYRRQ
ncbi:MULTISPECIES: COG1361 S-layer family protein [Halobacterium]|uniref:COG1361 S-layer family protein n=1 Tax=Halobacterium TaxID=2239 RepID=UPI001E41EED4|nr:MULTISPECIES: COG1361 S-layer family protein [Halobacterium]MCG1004950.1 COG1361 S-layer family protein [Halobacterium noricense]